MDQAGARAPKPGPYRFKPRRRKDGGGRIGSTNKEPRLLKDAIMLAAELEGSNGQGSGELVGFLRRVAREDPKGFMKLLGRALPLQQVENPTSEVHEDVPYKSIDEVCRELIRRGITKDVLTRLAQAVAEIDDEGVEMVDAKG
jgi:hypothetical protein